MIVHRLSVQDYGLPTPVRLHVTIMRLPTLGFLLATVELTEPKAFKARLVKLLAAMNGALDFLMLIDISPAEFDAYASPPGGADTMSNHNPALLPHARARWGQRRVRGR